MCPALAAGLLPGLRLLAFLRLLPVLLLLPGLRLRLRLLAFLRLRARGTLLGLRVAVELPRGLCTHSGYGDGYLIVAARSILEIRTTPRDLPATQSSAPITGGAPGVPSCAGSATPPSCGRLPRIRGVGARAEALGRPPRRLPESQARKVQENGQVSIIVVQNKRLPGF